MVIVRKTSDVEQLNKVEIIYCKGSINDSIKEPIMEYVLNMESPFVRLL